MVFPADSYDRNRGAYTNKPKPQKIAPKTVIRARPAPVFNKPSPRRPAPQPKYSPPPQPAPVYRSNSRGQYTSRAASPSPRISPGPVSRVGGHSHANRSKSGGGGGGRNRGGGGGGGAGPAKSKTPSLKKYLGSDAEYQAGISELMKTLQEFATSNKASRRDVKDAFSTATGRMEEEKGKSLDDLKADYGSRGILNSGLFAKAVDDYNSDYANRLEDLTTDRSAQLRNLRQEHRNMKSLTQSKKKDLRLSAIRNRAAKLGIRG